VDVLLADLKMPGMSGLELLRATRAISPAVEVIVITGYGSIEEAVEAMKEGAYDFLTKPVKRVGLLKAIDKALERQALVRENRSLQRRVEELQIQGGIIGKSSAMQQTLDLVQQIAPSTATVLIQGESGTGKEVIATAIHQGSPRRQKPFVKVTCAALPETLLESELFGYERGAFTGAVAAKPGRFELAHGGTLFLDAASEALQAFPADASGPGGGRGEVRGLRQAKRVGRAGNEDHGTPWEADHACERGVVHGDFPAGGSPLPGVGEDDRGVSDGRRLWRRRLGLPPLDDRQHAPLHQLLQAAWSGLTTGMQRPTGLGRHRCSKRAWR